MYRQQMSRPKILFLAHLLPYPLQGGGQIKSYHTLRLLSERYDVTLSCLIRTGDANTDVAPLLRLCADALHRFWLKRDRLANVRDATVALITGCSFIVVRDDVSGVRSHVEYALNHGDYSAIHIDHLQMAQFLPADVPPNVKVVLDQHNVEHRVVKRLSETPGANPLMRWYAGIEWKKLRDFEVAALRRADVTLAVSDTDRDAFLALAPDLSGKIETVPIGVDTDYFTVAERNMDADTLLSIGTMNWLPNVDGLAWFVRDVLPLVRETEPDARVLVVGANPAPEVVALGRRDPGIVVAGTVPDVRPYAAHCGVFIVPLRSGSGMRVKILNALAMGLPVVSTPLGAEGIAVTHGENILLADTPRAFADAVLSVLRDRDFGDRLGSSGRTLVTQSYGWNATRKRLFAAYDRVLDTG